MTWTLGGDVLLDGRFPLRTTYPFTTRHAALAGISRRQLTALVREGLLRRMLKGVYVAAQVPDTLLLRSQALALVVPEDATVTDWTACWLHTGVLPPGDHLEVPKVSVFRFAGRGRLRNELCLSGERGLAAHDLEAAGDVVVTTPLRTALDLGRLATRDWAIAGLDALLRTRRFTPGELLGDVERFRRQRGVVQLRALAPLADARAESPGESVLRLRWHDLRPLPQPQPQVSIRSWSGHEIYRIDLGIEELRFGVEYDGEAHHTSLEDRRHDDARRRDLAERFDWLVLGVTKANVFGVTRDVEGIIHEGIREARRRLGRPPSY